MTLSEGLTPELLDRFKKRIERSNSTPDRYHTNCKNCGQALLAPCWVIPETCPMCEVRKEQLDGEK